MSADKNPKTALTWAPEGKRRRTGWPREIWQRTMDKERTQLGLRTWREVETVARDKLIGLIGGPILHKERQDT